MRVTVIPKALTPFYTSSVEKSFNSASDGLHNPFAKLGYTNVKKIPTRCNLQQAQSIHTEIDCAINQQAYAKLPTAPSARANTEEQASQLQALLKTNGWRSGSNGVTLTSLIDGTARGKDYSPDAYYEKTINGTDCMFDTMIAYANPQPAAITSLLSCDRTVNILGAPKNEIYTSAKGHLTNINPDNLKTP